MELSEVEIARRRLDEARRVRDEGRPGASSDWLRAVEDYVSKCQEEYVRALERAQSEMRAAQSGGARSAPKHGQADWEKNDRRPD